MITLATLPNATEQEVFNQVVLHLLTQGQRAISHELSSVCFYRQEINDGTNVKTLKCAAGCLIADEEYDVRMEARNWTNLSVNGRVPKAHVQLISRLQMIHDAHTPGEWVERLAALAAECGLEMPEIPLAE